MRRLTITCSAGLLVLAIAPASALARHHHRRHHTQAHHARIERFGSEVNTRPTTSASAENAGTIKSFSGGMLTIMLGNGSAVSGDVTRATELECTSRGGTQVVHEDRDGGSGDQSGSGDTQSQASGDQSASEDRGDAAEQNGNPAAEENENEPGNSCSSANLTPRTVVAEAELLISSAGSTWKKIELES